MYSQSQVKSSLPEDIITVWNKATTIRGKKGKFLKYSNSEKGKVWVVHGNLYFAFIISNEHTCRSLILDRFCFSSAFTFSHHPYVSFWNKTFKDPGRRWQIEQEQQIFFWKYKKTTSNANQFFMNLSFCLVTNFKFPFNFFSCVPFMGWVFFYPQRWALHHL